MIQHRTCLYRQTPTETQYYCYHRKLESMHHMILLQLHTYNINNMLSEALSLTKHVQVSFHFKMLFVCLFFKGESCYCNTVFLVNIIYTQIRNKASPNARETQNEFQSSSLLINYQCNTKI